MLETLPDLPIAKLQAKWGSGISKGGLASFLGNGIAITSRENVIENEESPERICLVFPKRNGNDLRCEANRRKEPLVDPHIEALDILENGEELGSLLVNLTFMCLDSWLEHWKNEKLYIVGISPENELTGEVLEPIVLDNGYLQYETRSGDDLVGSPLIFKIPVVKNKWTLLGVHAFCKNGKGFGWPITSGISVPITTKGAASLATVDKWAEKIWQEAKKRREEED